MTIWHFVLAGAVLVLGLAVAAIAVFEICSREMGRADESENP